jgi:hypothetical protein
MLLYIRLTDSTGTDSCPAPRGSVAHKLPTIMAGFRLAGLTGSDSGPSFYGAVAHK